jgi:hypothetical protein
MKIIIAGVLLIALSVSVRAQWTTDAQSRIHYNGGNVGIGADVPQYKFEVVGSGQVIKNPSAASYTTLRLYNDLNRSLEMDYSGSNYGSYLVNDGPIGESGSITTTGAFPLTLGTNNTARMTLTSAGNIGIGTNIPDQKLHVKGRFYLEGTEAYPNGWAKNYFQWAGHSLIMGSPTGVYAHNRIEIKPGGSTSGNLVSTFQMFDTPSPDNHELKLQLTSNGDSFFNGGNVGIGTTAPGSFKLAVNGKIWTQEVNVAMTNPGPDYVFEKDYNLLPLSELETYITQNKHLPEVPSAKEMEADGLNLKEMNLLLLKKVEELTLHLIEQSKKNTLQETKINHLEKLVKEMPQK